MRGRTALQIRRYGRHFIALMTLVVVGGACGVFILLNQRLPNPFQRNYALNAAFPSAAAVVPGLGEPVNVAGVRVGQISGVSLQQGRAVIHMEIDPSKVGTMYRDATADLVPRTPLKDMEVDIRPGHPTAGALAVGATIPVGQSLSPTDADELLGALDTDTRTWLESLITSVGQGTAGRGGDLRQLFQTLGPTSVQLRQVSDLMAQRHHELAQIVHNFGHLLTAVNQKSSQLREVVQAGDVAIRGFADQNQALRQSIVALPATLQTARTTLGDTVVFANALGPSATALTPSVKAAPATLRDLQTLFQGAALLPLQQIPAFVSATRPLTRDLPPLGRKLKVEIPATIDAFKVLTYATNEITYNPGGRNPGFLYWLAWFAHNSNSFISSSDANGPAWRSVFVTSCKGLSTLTVGPILEQVLGTTFGCS
ncbi:MAG TPA: MlaD family protein [Solirubrobacteraceae bacterium]|nr:MlaD family protein [Solirubrobacteraceae bacterium]